MRSFLTILALVASAIAMSSFLLSRGENPSPAGRPRQSVLLPPDRTEVLLARKDGVEILLRARAPREEIAAALDAFTARRLGHAAGTRYVDLWVVNDREEALDLRGWPVRLYDDGGLEVAADLVRGVEGPWAALHADSSPLPPHSFRRLVLVLETPLDLSRCRGGQCSGLELEPRLASVEGLDAFCETPRPPLVASLDGPPARGRERR